jgi:hypothetical protein
MLLGGISCRSAYAQVLHERVLDIRSRATFPQDSLQWKHFRPEKFPEYKDLVDLFIEDNSAHRVDFTSLVVDTAQLDHARYNDGDGETFFQKAMYQLYVSGILRKYEPTPILRGFHGQRESRYEMMEVKKIINAGMAKEAHSVTYRPLRQFEYMDVSKSGPHQLADVLLGAVSYHWNASLRRRGQSRKRMLAEYLQAECCVTVLGEATPPWQPHFDVWKLRLRGGGSRA